MFRFNEKSGKLCYNLSMTALRWIIFGLIIAYFLLGFVFINLTISIRGKINQSIKKIDALIEQQKTIINHLFTEITQIIEVNNQLIIFSDKVSLTEKNRILNETEREIKAFINSRKLNNQELSNLLTALEENSVLIRNEIYRHNRGIDNYNSIASTSFFVIFVQMLNVEKKEKI